MIALKDLAGTYHLDAAHSSVGFWSRHAGIARVRGVFESFHGWAVIDPDDATASAVLVSIRTSSINTRSADRDAHLLSPDFLDAARHPAITFVGTRVAVVGDTEVEVWGDLTVRDVTAPVKVHFTYEGASVDPFGNERIGFTGASTISRSTFGLTWNAALETGGVLVSDVVGLEFEVSAVKQNPA